ncbi:MAG TPA: GTPase ObgE, partial [Nitrospirota bacterium]|nr:GTPase ObgE [Nitrospirota bacterium]
ADPAKLEELESFCREKGYRFFPISAVSGAGLDELLDFLGKKVEEDRLAKINSEAAVVKET